jgi:hypothetical protein
MIVPTITYGEFLFGTYAAMFGGLLAMSMILIERLWSRIKNKIKV